MEREKRPIYFDIRSSIFDILKRAGACGWALNDVAVVFLVVKCAGACGWALNDVAVVFLVVKVPAPAAGR